MHPTPRWLHVAAAAGREQPARYPAPVTATSPAPAGPASPGLVGQLARFVAVGAVSALVDLGVYQLLLHLGL